MFKKLTKKNIEDCKILCNLCNDKYTDYSKGWYVGEHDYETKTKLQGFNSKLSIMPELHGFDFQCSIKKYICNTCYKKNKKI
jgi:hypothetical protein